MTFRFTLPFTRCEKS